MRTGLGLIGLLVALAIVAVLVKKQMGAMPMTAPPVLQGQGAPAPAQGAASTVRAQSQQMQQQIKQQVETLMQQPRPMPEE